MVIFLKYFPFLYECSRRSDTKIVRVIRALCGLSKCALGDTKLRTPSLIPDQKKGNKYQTTPEFANSTLIFLMDDANNVVNFNGSEMCKLRCRIFLDASRWRLTYGRVCANFCECVFDICIIRKRIVWRVFSFSRTANLVFLLFYSAKRYVWKDSVDLRFRISSTF